MNRQEKELQIESLKSDFQNCNAAFLIGVQGLTVEEFQRLRRNIRSQGGKVRVAKNSLSRIASHDLQDLIELKPYFKKQVALVFAMGESPAVAKVLWDSAQDSKVDIVAGCFESKLIDKDMIKFLATLPPRPVLLGQLCGAVQAPLARHVGVLHQVLARFLYVLTKGAEKKQS